MVVGDNPEPGGARIRAVLLDAAAAKALTGCATPWLLGNVVWDEAIIKRAVLWLCEQTGKAFLKLDDGGDAFLLESVEGGETWGRYSFLGWRTGEGRGDHFWLGRAGLRLRLPGRRFLTVQYNLGNIWNNGDRIDLLDVGHGGGAAFAIDSPAGPLEVALGLAEDRKPIGYVHLGLAF